MRHLGAAACVLGLAGTAAADTLVVPSEPYPTLQAAVDAAGTGDTIVLSAGTYPAGADVAGRSDLRILGKGGPVIDGGGSGNGIDVTDCAGIEISGITLQALNNGIYLSGSTDVKVSRVALVNVNYEALGMNGCQGVVLSRCTFTTVGGKGIEDDGSTGVVVDRCTFSNCGEGAIVLSPLAAAGSASEGARITRCSIQGGSPGIRAGGAGIVIDRNVLDVVEGLAIDLVTTAGADGAVISRNIVTGGITDRTISFSGAGIACSRNRITGGGIIEAGHDNRLERNVVSASDFGIAVNGSGCTIRGNRLSDLAGNGLDLGSSGHTVEKNVVERCVNSGIYASVTDSTFTANRVADAPYGIIVVYSGNILSRNRVTGETLLDLWDMQVGGVSTYGKNAFRTTLFGPGM